MLIKILSIISLLAFIASSPVPGTTNANGIMRRQWDESEESFEPEQEWDDDSEWGENDPGDGEIPAEDTSEPPTGVPWFWDNSLISLQTGQAIGPTDGEGVLAVGAQVRL